MGPTDCFWERVFLCSPGWPPTLGLPVSATEECAYCWATTSGSCVLVTEPCYVTQAVQFLGSRDLPSSAFWVAKITGHVAMPGLGPFCICLYMCVNVCICTHGGLMLTLDIFVDYSPQCFLNFIISFWVCMHMLMNPWHRTNWGGQKTALWSWFPASTFTWISGIQLRLPDLRAGAFPCWAITGLPLHFQRQSLCLKGGAHSSRLIWAASLAPGSLASSFWVLVLTGGQAAMPDWLLCGFWVPRLPFSSLWNQLFNPLAALLNPYIYFKWSLL